jgi:putative ABC transport system permease protein
MAIVVGVALSLGMVLGYLLIHAIGELLKSDQFCFPTVVQPRTQWAML